MTLPMRLVSETSRAKPMKVNFTEASLRDWPVPSAGRTMIYDATVPGLAVRITSNGVKSYYYAVKLNGVARKKRLGQVGVLTLEKARKVVKVKAGIAAADGNPINERVEWAMLTFSQAFTRFVDNHKAHRSDVSHDRQRFDLYLKSPLGAKLLKDINRDDVQAVHNTVASKTSKANSNRVLSLVSAVFNNVTEKIHNPARAVKKHREIPRARRLAKSEVDALLKALDANSIAPDAADVVRVAMLTGQRRGPILKMKWSDINLVDGEWRISGEDMKSDNPHTVPLGAELVKLLTNRQKQTGTGVYVFPGVGGAGHLVDVSASWHKLIKAAGLAGVRFHDLRGTMASLMAKSGASLSVTQKALGHKSPATTAKFYVSIDEEQVRKASVASLAMMLGTADAEQKPVVKKVKKK